MLGPVSLRAIGSIGLPLGIRLLITNFLEQDQDSYNTINSALDKHIFPGIYGADGIQDAVGTTPGFVALKDDRRESRVQR